MSDALDHLVSLSRELAHISPNAAQLVESLQKGCLTLDEAEKGLVMICQEEPQVTEFLMRNAESLITHNPTSRLPRLNPLVEAALVERAQFDGDIPELRTGPLKPGVLPSVPVATRAKNPVALGQMLGAAATQMQGEIIRHEEKRLLEAIPGGSLDLVAKHGAMVADLDVIRRGSAQTDLPAYRRGTLPAAVMMSPPSGSELATLSSQEEAKATWATVSTAQGRRSLIDPIREALVKRLERLGFQIVCQDIAQRSETPLAHAQWQVSIHGKENLQPGFSFADVAAAVMAVGLFDDLQDKTFRRLALVVDALHRVDERSVGWFAQLQEVAS